MYQGHRNWNHWNVSLWISNDEGLYNFVKDVVIGYRNRGATLDDAARVIMADFEDMGVTHTPDGAPYSYTAIRAALRDI